jgi:hypothetical protein
MLADVDLGEGHGAGDESGVTPCADHARIGPSGVDGRVLGMTTEGPMAGLTVDGGVEAARHGLGNVGVAFDAGGTPGVDDGMSAAVGQRPGPEVAVLAEILGDEQSLGDQKHGDPGGEQDAHPNQVLGMPEERSHQPTSTAWPFARLNRGLQSSQ